MIYLIKIKKYLIIKKIKKKRWEEMGIGWKRWEEVGRGGKMEELFEKASKIIAWEGDKHTDKQTNTQTL